MTLVPIGVIIVAILFGSALLAMVAARFLPDHHLSPETKSVVSVSMAVVGTLSALVLSLLISTANASYVAKTQQVTQMSADVISLDRLLQRYGSQAQEIRALLQRYAVAKLQDLFPKNADQLPNLDNDTTITLLEALQNKILALQPENDTQRWLQGQALQLTATAMATRWELGQESLEQDPDTPSRARDVLVRYPLRQLRPVRAGQHYFDQCNLPWLGGPRRGHPDDDGAADAISRPNPDLQHAAGPRPGSDQPLNRPGTPPRREGTRTRLR